MKYPRTEGLVKDPLAVLRVDMRALVVGAVAAATARCNAGASLLALGTLALEKTPLIRSERGRDSGCGQK
jgi:hypothetical protein|eukprot:COSAG01_NODE_653_length_14494_cov_4.494199_2_plen_70_part_00